MQLGNGKVVRGHVHQLFSRQEQELPVKIPDLTPDEESAVPPPVTSVETQDTGSSQADDTALPIPTHEESCVGGSPTKELFRSRPPAHMNAFVK